MFKEGDFVRHKPSGCVGKYISGEKLLFVEWPCAFEGPVQVVWSPDDCEPVTDKQPVNADLYEAAERAKREINLFLGNQFIGVSHNSYAAKNLSSAGKRLEEVLANFAPVEPHGCPVGREVTVYDRYLFAVPVKGEVISVSGHDGAYQVKFFTNNLGGHNVNKHDGGYFHPEQCRLGDMLQPKEEPKCETCEHYDAVGYYGIPGCMLLVKLNPIYGMDGCAYKRKE